MASSIYWFMIAIALLNIMLFLFFLSSWLPVVASFSFLYNSPTTLKPPLRVSSSNQFHISIFSDLHFGENEDSFGITQDIASLKCMNTLLNFEKPDFVVINGDLITGENTFLENATKYVDVLVAPLLQHNISWASTYGNHDSQFNLSRELIFKEETKYAQSYTQHAPAGVPGVTNYYLPIYPPANAGDQTPLAILWFFDSLGGFPFQTSPSTETLPEWVQPEVVTWFNSTKASLKKQYGKDLPSLVFVHIPVTAFATFQKSVLPNIGGESAHYPGLNDDVPLAFEGDGWQDVPFMQALVDTPLLNSIYSGHDHGDAWCANWPSGKNTTQGVSKPHICFCKHTGYGGYGSWNRGSRAVLLTFENEGMQVESYVRMENGEIVQRVGLNETYGVDVYPKEDGQNY